MLTFPREIVVPKQKVDANILHDVNYPVPLIRNGEVAKMFPPQHTERDVLGMIIRRFTSDSSFSDIPRKITGVDIRNNESINEYLLAPNGGHLRSAFSEVEGLDRYAHRSSQESSKEIERNQVCETNGEQASINTTTTTTTTSITNVSHRESKLHRDKTKFGLTKFEQLRNDFNKRHQFRSEAKHGKRVGFYRLILDIGHGNFSKVKLATHTLLNVEVAVKVIDRTKFDAKTRRLLSQELANMERLSHPNIVQVFQVYEHQHKWFIIMEYAPAGELHSYLKRHGQMEDSLAKHISAQIVSALRHMHSRGVVHRDLKAENVLFMSPTHVKLGDFGFSKKACSGDALTTFCGSPPYAAPELFVSDSYTGPAVDVWALGVLIFYMVTGFLPFRGDSIGKIKRLILEGTYSVPSFVQPSCKELIDGILCRCTEKRLTVKQIRKSSWFAGYDWSKPSIEQNHAPNSIEDNAARDLLSKWWDVDQIELDRALYEEGPKSPLTGIYRILRAQGKKFMEGKAPMTIKKSASRKRTKSTRIQREDSITTHHRPRKLPVKKSDEVTTVDLRDQTALKGKLETTEKESTKTCSIL